MNRRLALILFIILLTFVSSVVHAEKIDEIKRYFELRDTISLVNLEIKRALAPDSKSPLLLEANSEQSLTRLVLFLEDRVNQFAKLNTPLRSHYKRNLDTLFNETRYLYSNIVVRIRSMATMQKPNSLVGKVPTIAAAKNLEMQQRPYFHPIDLRTLLSPTLLKSSQESIGNEVWANRASEQKSQALASDVVEIVPPKMEDVPKSSGKDGSMAGKKVEVKDYTLENTTQAPAVNPARSDFANLEPKTPEEKKNVAGKNVDKKVLVIPPPPENPAATDSVELANLAQNAVPVKNPDAKITQVKPSIASDSQPVVSPVEVKAPPAIVATEAAILASPSINLRPISVMIENHRKARPQSGLIDAELVYEMPVEGGITRFMAVFLHTPGLLGPVRSCREYFVDRALEVQALYVHCGGSPKGYAYLSKSKINSIDEIKHGKPFFRDKVRKAPHNLYSRGSRLVNYMSASVPMKLSKMQYPLNYGAKPTRGTLPGKALFIKYHGNYNTSYKLNNGTYERYMNGKKHIDRDNKRLISPGTVVIQTANMKTVDKAGRQEISFVGSGPASIFYDGTMIKGRWEKKGPRALTNFVDLSGQKIVFDKTRPTWIQVISPNLKVYYNTAVPAATGKKKTKSVKATAKLAKKEKAKENK